MALTEEQKRLREGKLTASAVACLMQGDRQKIMNLWLFMVGDPSYEEPDLSQVWPVRLGEATEKLNLAWYELTTGRLLTRRGEVVIHSQYDWAAATLDGWDAAIPAPIECKHVGGWEPRQTVINRYWPQCCWQMIVTGARQVELSIIEGAREPAIETILWDADYSAELWHRAEEFMRHVWDLTPPVELEPVSAPVAAVKTYDFSGRNEWASLAAAWLDSRTAAKVFSATEKELKGLVPADAARCVGHGISCSRDRAGRLSIKENVNGR